MAGEGGGHFGGCWLEVRLSWLMLVLCCAFWAARWLPRWPFRRSRTPRWAKMAPKRRQNWAKMASWARNWELLHQFWYHLATVYLCIRAYTWSIGKLWFVKLLIICSFLHGTQYIIDCLLAHSVINVNDGRPKAALVGLRFPCHWRAAEGSFLPMKDWLLHMRFQGPVALSSHLLHFTAALPSLTSPLLCD